MHSKSVHHSPERENKKNNSSLIPYYEKQQKQIDNLFKGGALRSTINTQYEFDFYHFRDSLASIPQDEDTFKPQAAYLRKNELPPKNVLTNDKLNPLNLKSRSVSYQTDNRCQNMPLLKQRIDQNQYHIAEQQKSYNSIFKNAEKGFYTINGTKHAKLQKQRKMIRKIGESHYDELEQQEKKIKERIQRSVEKMGKQKIDANLYQKQQQERKQKFLKQHNNNFKFLSNQEVILPSLNNRQQYYKEYLKNKQFNLLKICPDIENQKNDSTAFNNIKRHLIDEEKLHQNGFDPSKNKYIKQQRIHA